MPSYGRSRPKTHVRKVIKRDVGTRITYVVWLTLECGHRHRFTGRDPKNVGIQKTMNCFACMWKEKHGHEI
jgi:hypothetical protein